MGDEAENVENALDFLRELQRVFPRERELVSICRQMTEVIRPTMAFDSKTDADENDTLAEEFEKEVTHAIRKREPSYQTPPFKCIGDYKKCRRSETSKAICYTALAICMGRHIMPFVKHIDHKAE